MIAGLTLLHLLVLVYWLGGDLGAFVAGRLVTDTGRSVPGRAAAAKILLAVDMAPRTAMILAAPTGLSLAMAKGWVPFTPLLLAAIWLAGLAWLVIAWVIHLKHLPPTALARQADIIIRVVVLIALVAAGALGLAGMVVLPLFICLKLFILAGTIVCGLLIRRFFRDFSPAFQSMLKDGATPQTDAVINKAVDLARPVVMVLWALLVCAAFLGVATPT